MQWALRDLTAQAAACAAAPILPAGRVVGATTASGSDRFANSCGAADPAASGPDRVFKIEVPRRATVRLVVTAATFDAAIAVRRSCADASGGAGAAELACESDADAAHRTTLERVLEPGTYWVVVDGQSPNDQGPFTLDYRVLH
jgi:hypothetical protein